MKKLKTLLVISLGFLITDTYGQTATATAKTYLEPMVNMVGTAIHYGGSGSILSDYNKPAKGLRAGLSFQAGISPSFSLVSELYYIRKGGILKAGNPVTDSKSTLRLNSIELPVLARFHFGKLYLNAGPSVSYALSGKQKTGDGTVKLSFNQSAYGFLRFEAGLQAGGGIEFPLKQKRLAIDIRYAHGLTNIVSSGEMYNRALMISVHVSKAWKKNPLAKN